MLHQFIVILPEIMLTSLAVTMQIFGVFYKHHVRNIGLISIIISLGIIGYLLLYTPDSIISFSKSFMISQKIFLYKAGVLGFTIMSLIIYYDLTKIAQLEFHVEFVTLMLLATVGTFFAISSCDLILLFCGIELQALTSYALTAFNTKDAKSIEAGLKYFVLGAFISCLMLLGISFIYGGSGNLEFSTYHLLNTSSLLVITGMIFLFIAILFKLSAAPLHFWVPDVYEGAPISTVAYFSTASKIGIFVVLMHVLFTTYSLTSDDFLFKRLIWIASILSMIIGSLGAIRQNSLKRLMAYSTILNIGYTLIPLPNNPMSTAHTGLIYLFIYAVGNIGFFACLVALFGKKSDSATFEYLKGIANQRKALAGAITIIMFSMIGIPPLAGFFGKYSIFYNAILQGQVTLGLLGVATSVIAAYYYLKIIKYMYFMDNDGQYESIPTHYGLSFVIVISVLFLVLSFIIFPQQIYYMMSY